MDGILNKQTNKIMEDFQQYQSFFNYFAVIICITEGLYIFKIVMFLTRKRSRGLAAFLKNRVWFFNR